MRLAKYNTWLIGAIIQASKCNSTGLGKSNNTKLGKIEDN